MRYITTSILLFLTLNLFSQNDINKQIEELNCIWIAEDYLNSFDSTKSALLSRKSFSPEMPAGLRINGNELNDNILNIGYSILHDHEIYPEISKFQIKEGDTINEQGFFEINLNQIDSSGYYRTSSVYYSDMFYNVYLTWQT